MCQRCESEWGLASGPTSGVSGAVYRNRCVFMSEQYQFFKAFVVFADDNKKSLDNLHLCLSRCDLAFLSRWEPWILSNWGGKGVAGSSPASWLIPLLFLSTSKCLPRDDEHLWTAKGMRPHHCHASLSDPKLLRGLMCVTGGDLQMCVPHYPPTWMQKVLIWLPVYSPFRY